jgi:hypothetical protein
MENLATIRPFYAYGRASAPKHTLNHDSDPRQMRRTGIPRVLCASFRLRQGFGGQEQSQDPP